MGLDGIGKTGFTGYTNKLSQTNIKNQNISISFSKTNSIKANDNFYEGMGLNFSNKNEVPKYQGIESVNNFMNYLMNSDIL